MLDLRHDLAFCRSIRPQFVSDDALWGETLLLQEPDHQPRGGLCVPAGLDDLIENVAILVDGAPKPMFSTANGNHDLIKMPDITMRWFFCGVVAPHRRGRTSDPIGGWFHRIQRCRVPTAFPRKIAGSAETEIEPNCPSNDLWWKTVVLVAEGTGIHTPEYCRSVKP